MTTADEYRAATARLTANVFTMGEQAVTRGEITRANFEAFVAAAGLAAPEDEETRAAREEHEAFVLRLQQATRAALPNGTRDEALRRIGAPVPTGRVGTGN